MEPPRRRHVSRIAVAALVFLIAALVSVAFAAKPASDKTPPAVTLTAPWQGTTNADTTPSYAGAAGSARGDQSTITLKLYTGPTASGSPAQTLTTSRSGTSWTLTATSPLERGTYTARAQQPDKAGNTGFSSSRSFEVTGATRTDPVIAAAGDIACDPADSNYKGGSGTASACRQRDTSNLLIGGGLAKVLTLGDNQYDDGGLSKFQASYHPSWGRVKTITRPAVGNHEYGTSGAAGHFDYFNGRGVQNGPAGERGKGYYSFDVGSWHLIALNSNCAQVGGCGAGSAQERWLKADLAAHPATCTLAYWHHPRFSSGPHGNTTEMTTFWQVLHDAGADVVLAGHDHDYERFALQDAAGRLDPARGIREFVVGTGGKEHYGFSGTKPNSEARSSDSYGVLKLTLRASGYDWQFAPAVGLFADSGSGACH